MDDVIYRPDVLNQMDDLISRQELLKRTIYNPLHGPYIIAQDVLDCPSAQKKGHWVKAEGMQPPEYNGGYFCSECEGWAPRDWRHYKLMLSSHCPHCGADMRGEENG